MSFKIQNLKFIILGLLLSTLYLIPCTSLAQSSYVQFTYDARGNRTGRAIIMPSARKGDIASQTVYTTAIKDQLGAAQINIYPNPVISNLTVKIAPQVLGDGTVEKLNGNLQLFNVSGNLLKETTLSNNEGEIDFSNFTAGVYLLKINTAGGTREWKVVKE